jgi:hypothetical protein
MQDPKEIALAKLKELTQELESLVVKGYQAPLTPNDDPTKTSPEFEFEDAYSNPERAIAIIIETHQLALEAMGLPRRKIIGTAKAIEIIAKGRENITLPDRTISLNQETIAAPKPPQIIPASDSVI